MGSGEERGWATRRSPEAFKPREAWFREHWEGIASRDKPGIEGIGTTRIARSLE